jgi:hypothetical protein
LIAKQQAMAAEAERKRLEAEKEAEANRLETAKSEGERNRIVVRAGQLTAAISTIEVEGTALTVKRDQLWAQIQAAHRTAFDAEMAAAPYAAWSRSEKRSVYITPPDAPILRAEAANARANAASMEQQYIAICQQINFKAEQRDALVYELNLLRAKYEELREK